MESYLLLYLDAPMQSWGCSSKWHNRRTQAYPTKSGVIGLLCAALGVPRYDRLQIAALAAMEHSVCILRPGRRVVDFHTIGGGYDRATQREALPKSADGNTLANPVVTHREYLMDATFGVIIHGDTELLTRCHEALLNPCWGVWFGRKSCVPATPISQGLHRTLEQALKKLTRISGCPVRRTIKESVQYGTGVLLDVPVDFSTKEYTGRAVVES